MGFGERTRRSSLIRGGRRTLRCLKTSTRSECYVQTKKGQKALLLEIPLTRSATAIIKQIRPLLEEAVAAHAKSARKGKRQPTASYRLTAGAEPKVIAIRGSLTIYREVCLKNPNLKGHKLLEAVHAYYLSRKVARKAKVPLPLQYSNEINRIRAMRNLNRYVHRAQRIMLNVAKGNFPGDY